MAYNNRILLFLLISLLTTGVLRAQWKSEKSPVLENLNSISLLSENSGWIVGSKGTMVTKVGNSWIQYPAITDNDLFSVCIINKGNGWAVGSKGTILHYNGNHWEKFESPTKENLFSVSFRDTGHGIAVGNRGTILIYSNGSWSVRKANILGDLYTVSDKSEISLTGGGLEFFNMPLMKIEENSGSMISKVLDPGYTIIRSLAINDKNSIWTVGMAGYIFHYDGSSWSSVKDLDDVPTLNSVFFTERNKGIAVGHGGTILTYSGNGWTKEESPVDYKLNGTAISGNSYYAVGNNGTIVTLSREHEIIQGGIKNDSGIKIMVFPNPSAEILNIEIPSGDGFIADQISVTNVFGQVVFNKLLNPGMENQVYQINTSELNNGLYMINITSSGKRAASGKFMVKH